MQKNIKNRKIFLLILYLAMLTANSSTGFVLMLISFFILLFNRYQGINSFNSIIFKIIIIICLISIIACKDLIIKSFWGGNEFVLKLTSENITNTARFGSIYHNILYFLDSPIFGNGISQYSKLISSLVSADTATSFSMLAIYGLWGSVFSLLLIRGLLNTNYDIFIKILLMISGLIIMNTEPLESLVVVWLLLFAINKKSNSSIIPLSNEECF